MELMERTSPDSPQSGPDKIPALDGETGPITMSTDHMTETEIHQAIQDAKCPDQELFIKDEKGKVLTDPNINPKTTEDNLETSELELSSNLSSSNEIGTDVLAEEKKTIRRSKRLTKTNPIVRYNIPICHDYMKRRKKAELGQYTGQPDMEPENGSNNQS